MHSSSLHHLHPIFSPRFCLILTSGLYSALLAQTQICLNSIVTEANPHRVPVFEARMDFGLPGDVITSEGGNGASDILKVVSIFEGAGITCCMVGAGALIWFGAGRVRGVRVHRR